MSHTPVIYLYTIRHIRTGRVYVGMTTDPKRRWSHHRSYQTTSIGQAIAQLGRQCFRFEVVACCRTMADAAHTEQALIEQHDAMWPNGYNKMTGGHGGRAILPEVRSRLSAIRKGNTNARRNRIEQLTLDGRVVRVFPSAKNASEMTGVHRTHINRTCLHRPNDTAGGYRWRFAQQ